MRLIGFLLLLPFLSFAQGIEIIPKPAQVEIKSGFFNFSNGLGIKMDEADEESTFIMKQLATSLFGNKNLVVSGGFNSCFCH